MLSDACLKIVIGKSCLTFISLHFQNKLDFCYLSGLTLHVCILAHIGLKTSQNVSTLDLDNKILQSVGQQWWPIHKSIYIDFQRLPRQNNILLVTVLPVLPDIPNPVSSFLNDCARNLLQPISMGNNHSLYQYRLPFILYTQLEDFLFMYC